MNNIVLTGIIGVVTSICSGFTAWFFARKKYNSEVDNNLIKNMEASLKFYTKLSDDNAQRLEEIIEDNTILREQFEAVLSENNTLRLEIIKLRSQIGTLTEELKIFNHEVTTK